ncbi:uncharacterized protein LOC114533426 [Dendronephthya gigantea]|uniref:uncharacterized protein LOC114533426 n=1 Tax=Dendronephthya gigantea TaxID=151771 RepID=UPI00106D9F6B|nr:uncharacterized protein LOC114533426 [Dendronephthya gigantea]
MSWLLHPWLIFFGASLLGFEGCEAFFLRHTQSGKCVSAGYLILESTTATRYWAELVDDCLYKNASFRYLQSELVRNIATGGNLITSGGEIYRKRLFIYVGKSLVGKNFESSLVYRLKQTNDGSLYFYDKVANSCSQPDARRKYIDQKKNGCTGTAEQKFTFGSVTQYGTKMNDVHCSPKQHMVVKNARYGDFNNNGIFNGDQAVR